MPLLTLLVHGCGYSPAQGVSQDAGDARTVAGETGYAGEVGVSVDVSAEKEAGADGASARVDASGDISDGFGGNADATLDTAPAVDTTSDAPATVADAPLVRLDAAGNGDARIVPDAPTATDAPVAGAGRGDSGGTGGTGGMLGAQDALSDVPLAADGAGGASSGGFTASSGGAGGGGATGSGGSIGASAGSSTFDSTTSGGATSSTGGSSSGGSTGGASSATTGGTGGVATGGALSVGGSTQSALWSGCKLLLHMDETTWNGTAGEVSDASGAANSGMAVGSALTTDSPAKLGRAGRFDGSGHVVVPDASTLHAGGAFSVSAWVYPTALNASSAPGIVAKRIAYGNGTEFAVFIWTDNHVYVDVDSEDHRFQSVAVLNNNTWYHVAVVFDGSADPSERVRLYINGQLDTVHAHALSTVTPSNATIDIGNLPNGGDMFVGAIDEVAFWQRALTATEVVSLYQ